MYYLAVAPDHQLRGYGRAMVEAAEAWLRDQGIHKVQLMVRASNTRVGAFYDALGYERSDVQVFQRWLDRDGPTS
jgi:ribosomal protein S18 acetylase RimI-like enzyme